MTFEEADQIIIVWGRFLEYSMGKLNLAFGNKIPESFLPYPKTILLEAFEIINRDSYKHGDKKMMSLMHESVDNLLSFIDDDEAFTKAVERFNNPSWRKIIISSLKEFQETWITVVTSQNSA
jgi:hypothetical protein